MPSTQVKDILEHIRTFHHQVSEYYKELSSQEPDERVELLLQYLARHEENFNETLGKYEEEAAQGVLDTWLQFAADDTIDAALQPIELDKNMDPDEIIRYAMILDRRLIQLYREIADSTGVSSVRDLFSNLILMEESKDRQYARSLSDFD